jgi:hypothetical protein
MANQQFGQPVLDAKLLYTLNHGIFKYWYSLENRQERILEDFKMKCLSRTLPYPKDLKMGVPIYLKLQKIDSKSAGYLIRLSDLDTTINPIVHVPCSIFCQTNKPNQENDNYSTNINGKNKHPNKMIDIFKLHGELFNHLYLSQSLCQSVVPMFVTTCFKKLCVLSRLVNDVVYLDEWLNDHSSNSIEIYKMACKYIEFIEIINKNFYFCEAIEPCNLFVSLGEQNKTQICCANYDSLRRTTDVEGGKIVDSNLYFRGKIASDLFLSDMGITRICNQNKQPTRNNNNNNNNMSNVYTMMVNDDVDGDQHHEQQPSSSSRPAASKKRKLYQTIKNSTSNPKAFESWTEHHRRQAFSCGDVWSNKSSVDEITLNLRIQSSVESLIYTIGTSSIVIASMVDGSCGKYAITCNNMNIKYPISGASGGLAGSCINKINSKGGMMHGRSTGRNQNLKSATSILKRNVKIIPPTQCSKNVTCQLSKSVLTEQHNPLLYKSLHNFVCNETHSLLHEIRSEMECVDTQQDLRNFIYNAMERHVKFAKSLMIVHRNWAEQQEKCG